MIENIFNSSPIQGKDYIRVTTWLNSYEKPFNAPKIAEQVSNNPNSEYYGMEIKDILSAWQNTSTRGTKKHKTIEDWIHGLSEINPTCEKIQNELGITPQNTYSEIQIWSNRLFISGTPDIIQKVDDTKYIVHDIKTFTKVNTDKIIKTTKQIMTYCLLLKHSRPDLTFKPGKIILIRPKSKISENVTDDEFYDVEFLDLILDDYVTVQFMEMVKKRYSEIKKEK